ncbi:MAG: PEP-CTERM sorting domain-containing protein [Haloferula sp.]
MSLRSPLVALAFTAGFYSAEAATIARAISGSGDLNLTGYTNVWDPAASPAGTLFTSDEDSFHITNASGAPPSAVDSTNDGSPTDSIGIVNRATDSDPFFAIVDTTNGDLASGEATATWTFDTTSATLPMVFSFEIGAMGDFESTDTIAITVSADGSEVGSFTSSVNNSASKTYTLASGSTNTLDDPMSMNGVELSNVFTTFSTSSFDADSVVVTLMVDTDAGTEATVLRNFEINTVPEPGITFLGALGLVVILWRRRRP